MARTNKAAPKMVTVNGVRYRPEDAPSKEGHVKHKMRTPAAEASANRAAAARKAKAEKAEKAKAEAEAEAEVATK